MRRGSVVRLAAVGTLLFSVAGCDGVLDVENPDVILEDSRSPEYADALANGALSEVADGWDAVLSLLAIASDEASFDGPFAEWLTLDEGFLDSRANAALEAQWPRLASAYWYADDVISVLDSLDRAGDLEDPDNLARAYLYGALMYSAVADGMSTYAPSDLQEAGPEIPVAQMDSLYAVAQEYATLGLAATDTPELQRDLLAARARAGHAAEVRRRIGPPADVSGEGFVSDADAAADALAALTLGGGDWSATFDYVLFGAQSNAIGQFNCAGAGGNFRHGARYADFSEEGFRTDSVTLLDPIDGTPDPTVGRIVEEFVTPSDNLSCQTGSLAFLDGHEMRLIVAENALANADTVTFAEQVNGVRDAEGLSDWTAASGVTARDMLIHERMARLFMRGRRLADMYRFGIESDTWDPDSEAATVPGTLYPIPQSEIEVNCYLNGTCG